MADDLMKQETIPVSPNQTYRIELNITVLTAGGNLNVDYTVADVDYTTTGIKTIDFNSGSNSSLTVTLRNNVSSSKTIEVAYCSLVHKRW